MGSGDPLPLSGTSDVVPLSSPYTTTSRIMTALVLPKEQQGDQDEVFHEEGVF